jgi:carboxyl-terminal processing protease
MANLFELRRSRWLATLRTVLLMLALLTPGAVWAAPAPSPSPSNSPDKAKEVPIYVSYLKDPASLGFNPDEKLLDTVYEELKTMYVEKVPDDKLYEGVIKEATRLAKEDKLSTDNLTHLTPDRQAPEKIVSLYGNKIDHSLLYYAMIRGLLEGTDDPYSVLMTPKEYNMLMEQMQNETFGGIGIYIELDKDHAEQLTVVEPLEGTPAAQAGLLAGDQILKINGKPTQGMTLDGATALIRGQIGSQVVLTIKRPGVNGEKDYSITRGSIEVSSVSHKMLPNDIGYVRLRVFGAKTGDELAGALEDLRAKGAKGLIVDLRNNGGGYITAAIDVCSNFINPGDLVTFVVDRNGDRKDYNAQQHTKNALPMVLLVNQYSASASEITAGCLKDYGAAELIGVKTFGKGSVQQLMPLPSHAALKLTVQHFFTPKGNKINKVGVTPDIEVKMEPRMVGRGEGKDTQLVKAEEYLKSKVGLDAARPKG